MASEVKLPRLGQGMEAGTINKWLKNEGDTVSKGEPLFEIDTDKVTQEVESDYEGVLLKIVLPQGEAPVGQTIAYIGKAGEETPEPGSAEPNQVQPRNRRTPRKSLVRTGTMRTSLREFGASTMWPPPMYIATWPTTGCS